VTRTAWSEAEARLGSGADHTAVMRGFLAGVVRKKLALTLHSEKTDGERVYRVIGDGAAPQAA
jgi:hypothetical protein